jgi:hypothetical protein
MEPNPLVFLRAARREIVSEELFGAGLVSGASVIYMHRVADGLAQTILRHEALPGQLRAIRPRQLDLLSRIAAALDSPPPEFATASAAASVADAAPGEADVLAYDRLESALAACIRALREQPRDAAMFAAFCQEIAALEHERRQAYTSELARLRQEDADFQVSRGFPEPSAERLSACLRAHFPEDKHIAADKIRRLGLYGSKDVFLLEIVNSQSLDGGYVMRMEPESNVTLASLAAEAELLIYLKNAGLPVPGVLLAEADGARFGGGFLIMNRLTGGTRSPETVSPEMMTEIADIAAWRALRTQRSTRANGCSRGLKATTSVGCPCAPRIR